MMREFLAALIVGMAITAFLMLVVIPAAVAGESPACIIKRDPDGRIHRSERVRRHFQRLNPCPSTGRTAGACPGYVKDHVIPLCACGSDSVANLQWQTVKDAKEKDRLERAQCAGRGDGD
ncbi:MAG TPA: HNH endonuclease signature motif containing protein [Rhodocyclaceae bacterium]|nr:HNH endonuclease signature motif containing protein [Rhodocyclaceae bacterium]